MIDKENIVEVKDIVKEVKVVDANTVKIDDLINAKAEVTEIKCEEAEVDKKDKKRGLIRLAVALIMVVAIMGSISAISTKRSKAGIAIGGSHKISIKKLTESGNLNHFGMTAPVLFITLDDTGKGLPAGFDYKASDVYFQISEVARKRPNYYADYVPSLMDSTLAFMPYRSLNSLRTLGHLSTSDFNREELRKKVSLAWMGGVGDDSIRATKPSDKILGIVNSIGTEVTESNLKSELGNNIIEDGVYYKSLKAEKFNIKDWETLVTSANITKSLKLWNYFTDFTGDSFKITERIDKYMHATTIKDDLEAGYRTLDLLMTGYSMAKDSPAGKKWKTAINNYIKSNDVGKDGSANGANILIHTGVIYNVERNLYLITHMDIINASMGIAQAATITEKATSNEVAAMHLSKSVGIMSEGSHSFNNKLRESYGLSVKSHPNTARTAWSGEKVHFGSTVINYVLEKRPMKNDWKTLQDRPRPYVKRLHMPIVSKLGNLYKSAYGMNVVLANSWVQDPDLKVKAEVVWASNDKRSITVPVNNANVGTPAKFKFNLTTSNISAWESLAGKYKKAAISVSKVKRTKVKHVNETKDAPKSKIQNLDLTAIKKEGAKPTKYIEGDFVSIGTSSDLINILKNKDKTIDIFGDDGHTSQMLQQGETIAQAYDFEIQVMLYSGSLADPTSSYIFGDKKPNKDEVLEYKYTGESEKVAKKLTVTAKKGKKDVTIIDHPEYVYREYISEPLSYSEIKEGSVVLGGTSSVENYEAMAGVPSTERLYFTSGGSEFIVEIYTQLVEDEEATRKYTSWFKSNTQGCEFKPGDTLKGGTGAYSKTETFVANSNGDKSTKSVAAESSKIVAPVGASEQNITINGHTSSSTIKAVWRGNIGNGTPTPADVGKFDAGEPGKPCEGIGFKPGTQRTKAEPSTNWSVNDYNTALNNAVNWARALEGTNSTYTVQRIADSDGQIRQWTIGNATIDVKLSGGGNSHSVTQRRSWSGGVFTTSNSSSALLKNTDKDRLGNGWGWTAGKLATGSSGGCCPHSDSSTPHKKWDREPVAAVPPSKDKDGKDIPGTGKDAVEGILHTYNHSHSFIPGTDLTEGASQTILYVIEVTFKDSKTKSGGNYDGDKTLSGNTVTTNGVLQAHALCGPCCEHNTLQEVYDTWVQNSKYNYLRINAVNVYKISRSYVNGMEEITFDEDETITANINRGDPNIFYNIAEEHAEYSADKPDKPSLAGRVRYSLQAQQHDAVVWREKSTAGDMRTNKCDGMASTKSGNAVKSGGSGHLNQSWANGILYNNKTGFVDDEEWFKTILGTDKSNYSATVLDEVDKGTEEWKRFTKRRETDNKIAVISDMLILQTSTGDQSVLYHTKEQKLPTQKHFGSEEELATTIGELWDNNSKSASKWSQNNINIGGYTGKYQTPNNKFSSGSSTIATIFDNNGGEFDVSISHPDPDATVAGPKTYSTVTNVVNSLSSSGYKSSPSKMQRRMAKVSLLKMVKDGIRQNPINVNAEYVTGEASQGYQNILDYTRGEYEDSRREDYEFEYVPEVDDVLGYEAYVIESVYAPGFRKINNIVVHTPVSVKDATVVAISKSRDQRADLGLASAESLMDITDKLNYCPGTPELCDFRKLDCKYYQDVALVSFNFNPTSTVATIGSDGSATTKQIQTVKRSIDEDGTIVTSIVDNIRQLEYDLPAGFEIDKTNRFGTGDSLKAFGTRLSIPLSDLGLEYKASNRVQVEMDTYIPSEFNGTTMLVSFRNYDFLVTSANEASWNTGKSIERKVNGVNFLNTKLKLKFIFSMVDTDDCELYVNGVKITNYTRVNNSVDIDNDIVGDYINIGSWNVGDDYPAKFYIDNFVVTKVAGTHTHDKSCYTTIYNHEKFAKYTCTDPVNFNYTGEQQTFKANVAGWYKLEAWGAEGGKNYGNGDKPGLGGYSSGRVYLKKGETIQVYVGEKGMSGLDASKVTARKTFNGGGASRAANLANDSHQGGQGGGATDFRKVGGSWDLSTGLSSRMLVAGGGGGTGCASVLDPTGHGGGLDGGTTWNNHVSYTGYQATGGTQTAGGYGMRNNSTSGVNYAATGGFGYGADAVQCGAGGGGGYYGGGSVYTGGGGGGSSYIGGVSNGSTCAGVNTGNGKARVTLMEHTHTVDCLMEATDFNKHIHNKECITDGSADLVNALTLADRGEHSLIKSLLGTTVYTKLRNPSSLIYTWQNWSVDDLKQFRPLKSVKLKASEGLLVADITGGDPYFDVPVDIKADTVEKIKVYTRLVGATTTEAMLYFTNEDYKTYTTGVRQSADKLANTGWQWLEFDLTGNANWKGKISGLRFDLASSSSGKIEVGQIQVIGHGSMSAGTATKVLTTYSGFTTNTKQYGITDGASASTTTFSGGNIVNSGTLTGMEFVLPVNINNADALTAVRVTMSTTVPNNYGSVYQNSSVVASSTDVVNNGNGTYTITYDTTHWSGSISSIGFDTAHSTVSGTTRVSKIELIGYGNKTVESTESYASGNYTAHIHTQDCRYTPGEEVINGYNPVSLSKQHHTSNGGYTPATGWNSHTSNPGDAQRMYNGENIVSLTSPIDTNSYARIVISHRCLSYEAYYYNLQVKINGKWMTLQSAQSGGYIHSAWVENIATDYIPHPSPTNILNGDNVGTGRWSGLNIYLYTGKTYKIDDIKVSAFYYNYGSMWNNMSKPGDGIWVNSGKLPVTNSKGTWTTCNGALNTYSDLVGTVTPVERGTAPVTQVFSYTSDAKVSYKVPNTGKYTITVWGAQGGSSGATGYRGVGGYGAKVQGDFNLTAGETLTLLVGQKGGDYTYGGGGGGGSFVEKGSSPLIVAGGGGGASTNDNGGSGNHSTIGSSAGGSAGNGTYGGGGGGGWSGSGGNAKGYGGRAYTAGGQGGSAHSSATSGYGGYGGGGGNGWYGGGGGGGYSGGAGGRSDGYGGLGGYSYNSGTSTSAQSGVHSGHGRIEITKPGNVYYTGPNYVAPPNRYNYSFTPATITYVKPKPLTGTASAGLGSLNGTYAGILATINTISNYYSTVPQTIGGVMNPIFSCRGIPNVHQHTSVCETPIVILTCNEPHHYGTHYDASNPVCWKACNNDKNHSMINDNIVNDKGEPVHGATFINTDYEFEIYFPNVGDFYQTGWHGIGSTTSTRGKGYVDGMNTTQWTREKRVMFTFDVLFNNNGTWEQYLAGDWIELPVTGATYPYYKFYCTLNNSERAAADVYYEVEAINAPPSPGGKTNIYERDDESHNDNFMSTTNAMRFSNLTAYHGAYKRSYVDLVGRIGNLIMTDTDDMRFSNFFKTIKGDEWLVNGIINKVFEGDQARYLSWHSNSGGPLTDIRGEQVKLATGMYSTWGTQRWTKEADSLPLPLSSEKNNIAQLRSDALKPGYSVLFEISTQGNYASGLQVLPYFYALNKNTGETVPVDVWMKIGEGYKVINIHDLSSNQYYWDIVGKNNKQAMSAITDENWKVFKEDGLFDYVLNLDWVSERERRNHDFDEQLITEKVALTFVEHLFNGEETVSRLVDTPLGQNYALGTLQLLKPNGRARTFIGNTNTNTVNINGGTLTNLDGLIEEVDFNYKAQRWHLKLGLPSSATFTRYKNNKHIHPTSSIDKGGTWMKASEELVGEDWVILMTADIRAIGDIWNLKYDQGENNGIITVGGKTIRLPGNIPTVLAAYDSEVTSTIDVDTIGTH